MDKVGMGYAQENITPHRPVQLVGYDARKNNTSRGILDPLMLQVCLWECSNQLSCLITIDSLGFIERLTNRLRITVAKILAINSDAVMVCFSHTHSAPNAFIEEWYFKLICRKAIKAIRRARARISPVKAVWGCSQGKIGKNRRVGSSIIDNRIGVLKICATHTKTIKLLILRVTAHCNILAPDSYLISADYFGKTRELFKKVYHCPIMMIQGAAGDIRPIFSQTNTMYLQTNPEYTSNSYAREALRQKYFNQSMVALNCMANLIYESIKLKIEELIPQEIVNLDIFSIQHIFHANVPTVKMAEFIVNEAFMKAKINGSNWLDEVYRLRDNGIYVQHSNIEIQYLKINNGGFSGISNEIMSEIAINIADKANNPLLFFNGYTNGCSSYLPTASEYDKGGYEVIWANLLYYQYHGRVMGCNRDTAAILEDIVVKNWYTR